MVEFTRSMATVFGRTGDYDALRVANGAGAGVGGAGPCHDEHVRSSAALYLGR